ncbi:MAG: hypothetical protein ABIS43_21155 [Opitutus sp.]
MMTELFRGEGSLVWRVEGAADRAEGEVDEVVKRWGNRDEAEKAARGDLRHA